MKTTRNGMWVLLVIFMAACGKKQGDFDASGTFEATEVLVSSEAAGKILDFRVEEGMLLQAGQVVGQVDSVQLYLKRMQLLASVKATESRRSDIAKQIAATGQQITTARREKERYENLVELKAANVKQLDDINAQIALLEKQLVAQKSTLENGNRSVTEESSALEIQVAQLEDQLRKCRISSPISGTVLTKYAELGELAAVGKPLFKIADVENMFLRAYVVSTQLSKLKLGQQVTVMADYGTDDKREYKGRVSWISDKAEFTPKTIQTQDERANLVYAVKIAVKNDGYMKIGMYGEMRIDR